VRGTVTVSSEGGKEVTGPFIGRNVLGKLFLSIDFRNLPPPTQHEPSAGGPSPQLPSEIKGRDSPPDRLSGTWRTMTRWMVGPSRRIVPVVLAEGTWSVSRTVE